MFIGPVKPKRGDAFTLLEIMLAVAILGMMAVTIYRFVATNVVAVRLNTEMNDLDARYVGFANLLTEQLQELPPGQGKLSGDALKFNGHSRDEMTWICSAGPGLLTRYAKGDYSVTLRLRPIPKSDQMELGIVREPTEDTNPTEENQSWVPLLGGLTSLEIRYFDPRLNAWVDRWTDRGTLPHLVRLTIERPTASVPWEAIIPLRRTPL